jgi:hypothetical protein
MKAKLVGVIGWDPASDIELILPMVFGRSRSADVRIQQSLVSRRHSEFYESDGRLMIRDLGSTNGTRVNQLRIEVPTELLDGDLVTLGSVTFRISCEDHPATLADSRDDTAIALRTEVEQLFKVPATESSNFDTVPVDTFLRDDVRLADDQLASNRVTIEDSNGDAITVSPAAGKMSSSSEGSGPSFSGPNNDIGEMDIGQPDAPRKSR